MHKEINNDQRICRISVFGPLYWTYLTLGVQERPPSLLEEALRIVNDGLHDLGPVQGLDSLCVLDVTWAETRDILILKNQRTLYETTGIKTSCWSLTWATPWWGRGNWQARRWSWSPSCCSPCKQWPRQSSSGGTARAQNGPTPPRRELQQTAAGQRHKDF